METLIKQLSDKIDTLVSEVGLLREEITSLKAKKKPSTASKQKTMLRTVEKENVEEANDKYAVWLYNLLKPYHENKRNFLNATLEDWSHEFHIMFDARKIKRKEFVELIQWCRDNDRLSIIQSPGFFTKKSGKNYDTFLGWMEQEKKKNNKNDIPVFQSKIKKR